MHGLVPQLVWDVGGCNTSCRGPSLLVGSRWSPDERCWDRPVRAPSETKSFCSCLALRSSAVEGVQDLVHSVAKALKIAGESE